MRIRTSMRRGPRGIRDGHEQEKVAATAHDEYPSAPRAPSPWRNRDYLLLLSGQSVSALGSYISGLAYPLLALALTHSPAQAGLVSVGSFVSYLAFSLVAGVWVDRLDRRAIMVACAAGQALVAGSIPLAAALGHLSVPHLVVASAASTACYIFFGVAEGAALPRVLPPAQVPAAVARNEVVQSASALGGPPLGGLIYQALGRTAPMLLDAISYAVSALSLALLRTPLQEERAAAPRHIGREVADGLAWLRGQALVRAIMIYSGALFFVINASRFVLIVLARARGASASDVGLLLAVGSAGGLLGSLATVRAGARIPFRRVIIGGLWGQAALCLLYAVAPTTWALAAVWAGMSFAWPLYNAPTFGRQIALTPDEMQGRIQSVGGLLFFGPSTLSAAVAGVLLQTVGPAPTALVFTTVLLVVALAATQNTAIKAASPRTDW